MSIKFLPIIVRQSLLLIFLTIKIQSYSQDNKPNVIPPSPEAASLGKFVDMPVSYYSGTPEISIPIHEMKFGELSVPVSLSYHASGVKVDEISSWVGSGWALNAGGVITRVVFGNVDEYQAGNLGTGFLGLQQAGITFDYLTNTSIMDVTRFGIMKDVANGCYDAEPDLFFINVNGITGTFSFDWAGNIVVNSNRKIKIEVIWENGYNSGVVGWDLISDDGSKYKFRAIETTYSLTSSYLCYLSNPSGQISSWYLSEIQDVNSQRSINFLYSPYVMNYSTLNSESMTHSIGGGIGGECSGSMAGEYSSGSSQMSVYGSRISEIRSSDGSYKVEFKNGLLRNEIEGTNLYALGEIWIYDKDEVVKKFQMSHNYSTERLTLMSVLESGKDGVKEPYKFSYSGILPARDSKSIDYWGYHNGRANANLIPAAKIYGTFYPGADRTPVLESAKMGTLDKITFPTKGSTKFEYELHDYSFVGGNDVESFNRYEQKYVSHFASSIGTECIGNVNPNTSVNEKPFTVLSSTGDEIAINVQLNVAWYGDPYFGAGREPKVFILDTDQNLMYQFSKLDPQNLIVGLYAGNYILRTEATWSNCEGASDIATVNIGYYTDDLEKKIKTYKAGGLRVKSIKQYDYASDVPVKEQYFYYDMEAGKSSGAVYGENIFAFAYAGESYVRPRFGGSSNPDVNCQYQIRMARNPAVFGETKGSHVGYRKVTIKDGVEGVNGKTEVFYTSPYTHGSQPNYTPPFAPIEDYSFNTGNLTEKRVYNNEDVLLLKEINEYASSFNEVRAIKLQFKGGQFVNEDYFYKATYLRILGHSNLIKTTVYNYSSDEQLVKSVEYAYDSQLQNLKTKKNIFDDTIEEEKYYYTTDYVDQSGILNTLLERNVVGIPIETVITKGAESAGKVVGATAQKYLDVNGLLTVNKIDRLEVSAPIVDFDFSFDNINGGFDSRYYTSVVFSDYDGVTGNLLSYKLSDGVITSFVWGYSKNLPIAEVVGASYNQIFYTGFEDDGVVGMTHSGQRFYNGQTYTIPSELQPQGDNLVMTYWYNDGSWKLQTETPYSPTLAKAGAVGYDDVRVYPKGARMTTYTHDALVGVTSISDPNNVIRYFEYDEQNRLQKVRGVEGVLQAYIYGYRSED